MSSLSISAAWEEARAILAHDGKLLSTVALALVALPSAVNALINPSGMSSGTTPLVIDLVSFLLSLVALAGQLALIRLALGPSITVGGAIGYGIRRLPIYFVAVLILVLAFLLIALPLAVLLMAAGVPLNAKPIPMSLPVVLASLFYFGLLIFVGVRLIVSSAVVTAEDVGPIALLKRSWGLTEGHWLQLFGFLVLFLIAAGVVLLAVGGAVGVVIKLLFGTVQPLSAGALVLALVQSLISAAVTTLFAVMIARIYLQLSRRDAQSSVPRTRD